MQILSPGDAMEIIHYSICDNQKNGYIHWKKPQRA
jgi:hypothetical protein